MIGRTADKQFRLWLTTKDYEQVQKCANACGLTATEYIRKTLRGEPLILRPTQNAVEHFQSMQQFQVELISALDYLPRDKSGRISQSFNVLLQQAKRLI